MSSIAKKKLIKTILTANGCNCRTKHSDVFQPKPKSKPQQTISENNHKDKNIIPLSRIITEVCQDVTSAKTTSLNPEPEPGFLPRPALPRISEAGSCIAVVKESEDPYHDFRESMLQMVAEGEMYSKEYLQGLLHSFLRLNDPCHQDAILRAFMEIWNEIFPDAWLDSSL